MRERGLAIVDVDVVRRGDEGKGWRGSEGQQEEGGGKEMTGRFRSKALVGVG